MSNTILQQLKEAVSAGRSKVVRALAQEAIDQGIPPADIVGQALMPAMADVGDRFKRNLIFVPEMLIAGKAMKEALVVLQPSLTAAGVKPKYTAVIGTVRGDLHDIGKNLVAMMWRGAGFAVIDLGTDVAPEKFVAAIHEHSPHLVGLSALLTTTVPAIGETIRLIRNSHCPATKILIGGAPVSQQLADDIGADGYAPDAGTAVDAALRLVEAA